MITGTPTAATTINNSATVSSPTSDPATGNNSSGTISTTVSPGPLDHIVINPHSSSIAAGASQTYTAEAFDQYGNSRGDVTGSTTFTITPDGSCTGATCTATVAGPHTVKGSSSGKEDTATLTVTSAALDHIAISPHSSSIAAGASQTYTAEAFDRYGNSRGDVTSGTTFSIAPNGSCTAATCTATVSGSHMVTGTYSGKSDTATLTVNPAALDHIVIAPKTATITAGGSQAYTAEAFDQYNNSRGDVTGSTTFTIGPNGSCTAATCTATVSGSHTVTGTFSGKQDTATLNVNPAAAESLKISGLAASTTAGQSQSFTVTAYDHFNNVATGYSGTVQFSSSDSQAVLPPNSTLTNGTGNFSATFKTAPSATLTARDTVNSSLADTKSITVNPATAASLTIGGLAPSTTAGTPQSFTVTLKDTYGNNATGYTGTVHFSSNDTQAGLPSDYTFTAGDAGVHNFSATFKTAPSATLTATDSANSSLTDTRTIVVTAAAPSQLIFSVQPSNTPANLTISPAPTVQVAEPVRQRHVRGGSDDRVARDQDRNRHGRRHRQRRRRHPRRRQRQGRVQQPVDRHGGLRYQLTATGDALRHRRQHGVRHHAGDDAVRRRDGGRRLEGPDRRRRRALPRCASSTTMKLESTSPGSFHWRLTLQNETGVELHEKNVTINAKNGGVIEMCLTIPALPAQHRLGRRLVPAAALPVHELDAVGVRERRAAARST